MKPKVDDVMFFLASNDPFPLMTKKQENELYVLRPDTIVGFAKQGGKIMPMYERDRDLNIWDFKYILKLYNIL